MCIWCAAAELAKASAEAEEEVEAERTVPSPRGGHTSDASGVGFLTFCTTWLRTHVKVCSVMLKRQAWKESFKVPEIEWSCSGRCGGGARKSSREG